MIHRYRYDADNRLEEVHTSTDGLVWNRDASYYYYPHGPLARVELGEYNVQGDEPLRKCPVGIFRLGPGCRVGSRGRKCFGWLKGVNLPYAGDPGGDGIGTFRTGGDAFAFALGYYEGDYKPINPNVSVSDGRDKLWDAYKDIRGTTAAKGLYNGNISWMSTDLPGLGGNRMQGMVYGYDQLHRIVQARSLSTYDQNGLTRNGLNDKYDADYSYDPNGNLLSLKRLDAQTAVQDDLTYEYYAFSNKLKNVDGSEDENYTYDEIGNLIADTEEGIMSIEWTPYGKVRKVVKDDTTEVHFRYDASGNRIAKITATDTTVYARDASGNVMAVYKNDTLTEQSIYGSSRLGLVNYTSKTGYRSLGGKKYELSNHLGNVLAVVSDNIHLDQDSTWTSLINTTDYYPFGLAMDGRSVQDSAYRYGFNGKEEDSGGEWGSKSHYDYGFRIYNPEIAKFLSVDPLTADYPWYTPYQFAGNTPIAAIDLDGLEENLVINEVGKQTGSHIVKQTSVEVSKKWVVNSSGRLVEIGVRGGMGAARLLSSSIGAFLNVLIPTDPGASAQFASIRNYDEHRFKELSDKESSGKLSESDRFELDYLKLSHSFDSKGNVVKVYNRNESLPKYVNPGHHDPSRANFNRTKSVLPENHENLWNLSIEGKDGNRWTKEGNGKKAVYHRFQDDGNGNWHWNGATNGKTKDGVERKISINNVPIEIQRSENER